MLAGEDDQVAMQRVTQDLRTIHPQRLGPALNLGRFIVRHPEAKHCHTLQTIAYDTDDDLARSRPRRPERQAATNDTGKLGRALGILAVSSSDGLCRSRG